MYTKATAACGPHSDGKAHYPKTFGSRFAFFPFPRLDLRLKHLSKPSPRLYPLVHRGSLTSDISIKSGDVTQKDE